MVPFAATSGFDNMRAGVHAHYDYPKISSDIRPGCTGPLMEQCCVMIEIDLEHCDFYKQVSLRSKTL